ncbi:MAG: nucleoside deaminase [Xanthomonadales bacterium]|nr:nucleoside deaminase [Xanthomonadales bacterium]
MTSEENWITRAIALAGEAADAGERPFGAVIFLDDEEIAAAANSTGSTGLSSRHAELNVIEIAQRSLGRRDLSGLSIACSAEPCPMCAGAIFWARLDRVFYGASIPRLVRLGQRQLSLRCGAVLRGTGIGVTGPVLEESALQTFRSLKHR